MSKIAIVSTMLPRLELDFVDEWLRYHTLVVDEINIFYDSRSFLANNSKVWSKKPFADYHLDKSDDEVIEQFKNICSKYSKVNLTQNVKGLNHVVSNQMNGLFRGISNTDADYVFHIDCDEFLKIGDRSIFDSDKHIGIKQQIMDLRWLNGKSVKSVKDIVNGKQMTEATWFNAGGSFGNRIWKSCWHRRSFLNSVIKNKVEPHILNHHGHLVEFCADRSQVQIFHYVGWEYRKEETFWKTFKDIKTTEFQKHFEKIVFGDFKYFL